MITANSRYATATIHTGVGPDGETRQEMRIPFPKSRAISYTYHRVLANERIDVIADSFYGDGKLWWRIADANPEIFDWFDLQPGEVIRVPNA